MHNFLFLTMLTLFSFMPPMIATPHHYTDTEVELATALYDIGVACFDTITLHCPLASPYYIDLRHIMSYPEIMEKVISCLSQQTQCLPHDIICGVPYAALALAANVSYTTQTPLIMRRTHIKNHGTRKKIEGHYKPGMTCVLIEDVITSGSSLMETIVDLEKEQLIVHDCIVLFDREQGGVEWLRSKGYNVHVIFTVTDFMNILSQAGKIDHQRVTDILEWTAQHQVAGL